MSRVFILPLMIYAVSNCWAQSHQAATRPEAEYYVNAYARHYRVPVALVRAVVERESDWRVCAVSPKGAVGLMQLMSTTAQRLGVKDRCNIDQNVSGALSGITDEAVSRFSAGRGCLLRRGTGNRQTRPRIPKS